MSMDVVTAQHYFFTKDYDNVIKILTNAIYNENIQLFNRPKVLSMLGISYFFTGDFRAAYITLDHLYNSNCVKVYEMGCDKEDYDPLSKSLLNVLENNNVNEFISKFPESLDFTIKQSHEAVDEMYPESKEYLSFVKSCKEKTSTDSEAKELLTTTIDKMIESSDNYVKSKGYYFAGEFFFMNKDYEIAYKYYLNAAINNPTKAIYFGYASNCLYKIEKSLITAGILNSIAINLDFKNPRWHLYQGLLLSLLATETVNTDFLFGAKLELDRALNFTRYEQVSLKQAIIKSQNSINNVLETIGNISQYS